MDDMDNESTAKIVIKSIFVIVGIIAVIAIGITAYTFADAVFSDSSVTDVSKSREYEIIVGTGSGFDEISSILKEYGLINNKIVFRVQYELSGYKGKIKAGTYKLNTAMAPSKIIETLCSVKEE